MTSKMGGRGFDQHTLLVERIDDRTVYVVTPVTSSHRDVWGGAFPLHEVATGHRPSMIFKDNNKQRNRKQKSRNSDVTMPPF